MAYLKFSEAEVNQQCGLLQTETASLRGLQHVLLNCKVWRMILKQVPFPSLVSWPPSVLLSLHSARTLHVWSQVHIVIACDLAWCPSYTCSQVLAILTQRLLCLLLNNTMHGTQPPGAAPLVSQTTPPIFPKGHVMYCFILCKDC